MMPRPIQQMYSISQGYQPGVSAPERTKRHHRRSVDRIWPPALEVKIARLALDELHGQRSDHTGGEIHSDGDDTIMTSEGEAGRGTPSKRLKGQDHNASPQWKLPQQELTQSPSVARRHPLSPLLWDHTTGGCHIIPRAPPLPKSQEDQHIDEDLHTDDELEHDDDENYQRPQTITATMPAQDARTTSSVYMKSSASTPASWVSSASPSTCSTSPWFYPKGQIKVQYRRPCRSQKAYMLHSLELGLSKIADSCSEDENEQDPDLGPLEAHRYHRHRSGRGDTGLEQDSIDQEQERLYGSWHQRHSNASFRAGHHGHGQSSWSQSVSSGYYNSGHESPLSGYQEQENSAISTLGHGSRGPSSRHHHTGLLQLTCSCSISPSTGTVSIKAASVGHESNTHCLSSMSPTFAPVDIQSHAPSSIHSPSHSSHRPHTPLSNTISSPTSQRQNGHHHHHHYHRHHRQHQQQRGLSTSPRSSATFLLQGFLIQFSNGHQLYPDPSIFVDGAPLSTDQSTTTTKGANLYDDDERMLLLGQTPNESDDEFCREELFMTERQKSTRLHQADSPIFFNGFPLLNKASRD